MYVKKIHQFPSVLKKMQTEVNWFFFSASRCSHVYPIAGVNLPVVDGIKVLGSRSIGIWHFTSMSWQWCDCAITMHRPSNTFHTCWLKNLHRPWSVVWSCPGLATEIMCSMALQATASRNCSEYRTTQLGSFSRHQDDPVLAYCWQCYTGCPFSRGSSTKWLCWCSKSAAPRLHRTSVA